VHSRACEGCVKRIITDLILQQLRAYPSFCMIKGRHLTNSGVECWVSVGTGRWPKPLELLPAKEPSGPRHASAFVQATPGETFRVHVKNGSGRPTIEVSVTCDGVDVDYFLLFEGATKQTAYMTGKDGECRTLQFAA
jgi:hypothetical protein